MIVRALSVLMIVTFSACQTIETVCPQIAHEVGIYAGGGQTRTSMQPNGLSASWEAGDELAVWAKDASGTYILQNQIFKAYGLENSRGFFTSVLDSSMPEGTFTYYCCYPAPVAVNGSKVSFHLPSVQDGTVSGGADIMIANPMLHGALKPLPEVEDHSDMHMEMNRMMHQFRFYIPEDNNIIGEEKLERILLTFPTGVTGTVTLDLENPDAKAELTSASAVADLRLAESLAISGTEPQYACFAFVPTRFSEGEFLQIKAYTHDRIVLFDPVDFRARNFEAGHSTPVRLNVKELVDYPYSITFSVSANNLGESLNTIVLTAPEGTDWDGSGSNVYTYTPGHKITAGEKFTLRFEDEAQYRAFSGKSISVTYDSDNTLTYQTVAIADVTAVDHVSVSLTIPYLFFEDFSAIPDFNDGHDAPGTGLLGGSDTYTGISELSTYAPSLAGWWGTRVGGAAGTAARICCRYENVVWVGAYYKGRLYTPFLSNIKEGKDVNVSVSFRYGSNHQNADSGKSILYFGINYQDEVTNPDKLEGDSIIDSAAGLIGGSGFASSAATSLSPMVVNGEELLTSDGSYTSFEGIQNLTISGVDNGMRLGWIVSTSESKANGNANFWLYIDDIIVKVIE